MIRKMYFTDFFLTRGRLPLSSFLCFVGGFSMGSWLTLFHQLQAERDFLEGNHPLNPMSQEPQFLLSILILSSPTNLDHRNTLRTTWLKLNPSPKFVKHYFAIGTEDLDDNMIRKLGQEHELNSDLLLFSNLKDNYKNLTLKLTHGLSYININSPSHYILKCDDDSFGRLDLIVPELEERERRTMNQHGTLVESQCFYWGYFDGRARVQKKGKWKEGDYGLCDTYLPYALGGGYVISKDCINFILKNKNELKKYTNEDVSVGTWLSVIAPERKHDVRFDTEYESRGCSNQYLVQHKLSQSEMIERYRNIVQHGKLCPKEFKKRSSYIYDWNAAPSNCCQRNSSII